MTSDRVVIVGAGQAGSWVARTLREEGYSGGIILVGAEAHAPYERPPLSKEILLDESEPHTLTLLDDAALKELNIDTRFGTEVAAINRNEQHITLVSGEQLPYSKLVLCTGGRARRLAIEGIQHERVHTLRSLDDALRLKAALTTETGHVLVIGGGWIGLEVGAAARQLGCEVTIVEFAQRLCQRSVAPDVSDALLALHASHQNKVLLNTNVVAIVPSEDGLDVKLSSGKTLQCAHIIMAAGLIANDELALQAGLICENGIHVDERCLTSDPNIYAAGDVAVTETASTGARARLESWQNAQDQGMAVGRSILGQDVIYRPTPMLWSQQFDHFIQIAGDVHYGIKTVLRKMPNGASLRFYLDTAEAAMGVIGVNAGRDFRFARQLVERRASISPADLADVAKPLKQLASLSIAI